MNIIYTDWWQAIGLFLGVGVIMATLYCLWDLKREQRAAAAEESATATPEWKTQTVYLKKSASIYPKNPDFEYQSSRRVNP